MKVFFTASQKGKDKYESYYIQIFNLLKKKGFTHVDSEIISQNSAEFYKNLEEKGSKGNVELYEKNINNIKTADINVFECSFNSLSVGFMVEKSLELNKPTIVLFVSKQKPFFLEGIQDEKLITGSYDLDTLDSVLSEVMDKAANLRDKRFNFFISPSLLEYLELASKQEGITKSTFIRNLLINHKRKIRK